jgi:hypothetical protein
MTTKKGGISLDEYWTRSKKRERNRPRFSSKLHYRVGQAILELADDYNEEGIAINRIPSKISSSLPDILWLRKNELARYIKTVILDLEQGGLLKRFAYHENGDRSDIRLTQPHFHVVNVKI